MTDIIRYNFSRLETKIGELNKKLDKILDIIDPDVEPATYENPVLEQQLSDIRKSIAKQPLSTRMALSGKFNTNGNHLGGYQPYGGYVKNNPPPNPPNQGTAGKK